MDNLMITDNDLREALVSAILAEAEPVREPGEMTLRELVSECQKSAPGMTLHQVEMKIQKLMDAGRMTCRTVLLDRHHTKVYRMV